MQKTDRKSVILIFGTGLIVGISYIAALVFCLGGAACDAWLPLLKFPFLFLMQITGARLFGFDALNALAILNATFWLIVSGIVAAFLLRRRNR